MSHAKWSILWRGLLLELKKIIYYGDKAFSAIYLRHPSYERAPFFSPESLETETQVSTFLPEYKIPSLVREGDAAT